MTKSKAQISSQCQKLNNKVDRAFVLTFGFYDHSPLSHPLRHFSPALWPFVDLRDLPYFAFRGTKHDDAYHDVPLYQRLRHRHCRDGITAYLGRPVGADPHFKRYPNADIYFLV